MLHCRVATAYQTASVNINNIVKYKNTFLFFNLFISFNFIVDYSFIFVICFLYLHTYLSGENAFPLTVIIFNGKSIRPVNQ